MSRGVLEQMYYLTEHPAHPNHMWDVRLLTMHCRNALIIKQIMSLWDFGEYYED